METAVVGVQAKPLRGATRPGHRRRSAPKGPVGRVFRKKKMGFSFRHKTNEARGFESPPLDETQLGPSVDLSSGALTAALHWR